MRSKIIENKSNEFEIANRFAEHFSKACSSNSVESSKELHEEYCHVKSNQFNYGKVAEFLTSVELVDTSISKLKLARQQLWIISPQSI